MNDTTNQAFVLRRQWLTLMALIVLILLLASWGEMGRIQLRYEREAIIHDHQYWRLLTGHLVHGSWQHTGLNLAGLLLIVALFRNTYSVAQWCWIGVLSAVGIDVGLLVLMPQLQWYVGLSGVLHGLLAAGAVAWWRVETKSLAAVLSGILLIKLGWEQWQGALPLSGDLSVIVNAHLYGALSGLLIGLVCVRHLPVTARHRRL